MIEAAQEHYEGMVQSEVLRITRPGDELLMRIVHEFEELRERSESKIEITCFYELMPCSVMSVIGKKGNKVCAAQGKRRSETDMSQSLRVDETAGTLDRAERIGLQRTHFNMNKFGRPNEEEYKIVRDEIKKMAVAAIDQLAAPSQSS
jgi:hypothetical protein